jgi:hypothetical protein
MQPRLTKHLLIFSLLCGFAGACAPEERQMLDPAEEQMYQEFLLKQHQRYPKAKAEDYYKLIYQSVLGVGHLVEDEASARSFLRREIYALGPAKSGEALLESLDPQGVMVRVNLRPFVDLGLSQEDLVGVLMETSKLVQQDTMLLRGRWNAFRNLVEEERLQIPKDDVRAVDEYIRKRDYPVLRHSDEYRGAYKPAYRVVLRDLFEKRFPTPK